MTLTEPSVMRGGGSEATHRETTAHPVTIEEIDAIMASVEAEQAELHQQMAEPGFYQQGGTQIAGVAARLTAIDEELKQAYLRWEALEGG